MSKSEIIVEAMVEEIEAFLVKNKGTSMGSSLNEKLKNIDKTDFGSIEKLYEEIHEDANIEKKED